MPDGRAIAGVGKVRQTTSALFSCCWLLLGILTATPSNAATNISMADLQAATRAIGFLDTLPHDGTLVIGIVFAKGDSDRAMATATASQLAALPGPANATIRTVLIPEQNFAKTTGRLDIVILMPMPPGAGKEIAAAVRTRQIVSISTDRACLDSRCCVLMIQTAPRVEIVLDTVTANDVGARFSPVFTMLVKRR